MSLEELAKVIQRAKDEIGALAKGKRWVMCVPVQPDDSDMVLMDALLACEAQAAARALLLKENITLSGQAATLVETIERLRREAAAHAGEIERERQRCVKEHEAINKLTRDQQVQIRDLHAAHSETIGKLRKALDEASEERYQFLRERALEAAKWKGEGDMYGWNFHMGMSAGANWCDIMYRRIGRVLEQLGAPKPSAGKA